MPETLVDQVERDLRAEIVQRELRPATPLRITALVERYRVGATPIREALSRLASEGLVEFTSNKGFRVPPLSRHDLEDLIAARTAIETEAVRLSMLNGDVAWEAGIVAALHQFRKGIGADAEDRPGIDKPVHDQLHKALTCAANSPRLAELQHRLLQQHKRYQQLPSVRRTLQSHVEEHADLADVVLSRNIDAAVMMVRQHLRLSIDAFDYQQVWDAHGNYR